jgi:leucyl aminopeptidase
MEFITRVATAEAVKTDCVAVGVYDGGELSAAARRIDGASKGALRAAIRSGDATGKAGSTLMLRELAGVAAARVLLVGLGKKDEFKTKTYLDAVRAAVKNAGAGATEVTLAAEDWHVADRDVRWQARLLVITARETAFRSDELKSKKDDNGKLPKKVALLLSRREADAERGLAEGTAIANGMELTKRLGNLPGNICTPTYLADQARQLGREWKLGIDVHDRRAIERLKMGSFLSVAKGSAQEPRLIVFKYNGGGKQAPIALVGKGITFDSGGISLKPGANMDEMKFDMCGAATVFGTLRAAAELKLKINLVGVVVACENMPSSTASKPGDIVTSMSGQTVEVLNTDAEGRLILNDALTFVARFKPATVIDIATLTGACVIALGAVNSGLFTEDEELARALISAGRTMNDYAWRLPLDEEYQEQLKSNFADMANIGTPGAGAVVAACFLQRFAKDYNWAHLDIAGTAWKTGPQKGATGRPVPLLSQYLIEQAG